jgi:hypothetical protein
MTLELFSNIVETIHVIFRLIRYGPGIILIETVFLPDQFHTRTNHIDGAMESVLASSVVGRGFEPRWGQIRL